MQPEAKSFTRPNLLLLIALIITPMSGLGIDIYIPSLPAVSTYFQVDNSLIQLSITLYMLGLGLMQLVAGAISDSFGRKIPTLIAISIFILTSILVPFSPSITYLLFLRLIQGMMVAMMVVPMRSVIPDLFTGRDLYKATSYMTLAWSIGPIVAPAIGGYLQYYIGWKANFYFLAIYSIVGFILILFFLPETSTHRHVFDIVQIIRRYKIILRHRIFLKAVLINSLIYSIVILFAVIAPFLIQDVLHYSSVAFGHMALLIGVAWLLGSLSNRFMIEVSVESKLTYSLWGMLLIAILMFVVSLNIDLTIYNIIIPIFFLVWLGGIIFPNNFAQAVELFPQMTGSVNALLGALLFSFTALISFMATFLKTNSTLPLAVSYLIFILLCLILFYFTKNESFVKNTGI